MAFKGYLLEGSDGIYRIGSGTESTSLATGSLYITGDLEIDGDVDIAGVTFSGGNLSMGNNDNITWSSPQNAGLDWHNALKISTNIVYDQSIMVVGSGLGTQMVFGHWDWRNNDFDHANQSHPTMFFHSATDPNVDNTQ